MFLLIVMVCLLEKLKERHLNVKKYLGVIHLVRAQNFPKY